MAIVNQPPSVVKLTTSVPNVETLGNENAAGSQLTAEEFLALPDFDGPCELVEGRIVMMNVPANRHGVVCGNIAGRLFQYCATHDCGRVLVNDSGVITRRGPDSVRGADVAYYSYQRVSRDYPRQGYWDAAPELIFELLSPSDRQTEVLAKVAEYLAVGVLTVCVVDPEAQAITGFPHDASLRVLAADQTLELPTILPGFGLPVQRLFE